jgi:hypothetical protein
VHLAHLFEGLSNRVLRPLVAGALPGYIARQVTYDLRDPGATSNARSTPASQTRRSQLET